MSSPYRRQLSYGTAISSEEITAGGTAVALTVPAKAKFALVSARQEDARFRLDGNNPTAATGHPLPVDNFVEIYGEDIENARFISQSGTDSILFVTYFK